MGTEMEKICALRRAGLTIYDVIPADQREALLLTAEELEQALNEALNGCADLAGLPLRTRSKRAKELVCSALGYPVPSSFRRVQPRFPSQDFDVYVQKSNNLQIWNEEVANSRRYVLIRVNGDSVITKVKVVTGELLTALDSTGTLTQKFQATLSPSDNAYELISDSDTVSLADLTVETVPEELGNPTAPPTQGTLQSIGALGERLRSIVGAQFADAGIDQERNRGAALHAIVCRVLGYEYHDAGQFPDLTHQLLEVKLQTSPTIDLGLVEPNSTDPLQVVTPIGVQIQHRDVRYAVFFGTTDGEVVTICNVYLTTGADFFTRFPRIEGNVKNKKLQIPLPNGFFD